MNANVLEVDDLVVNVKVGTLIDRFRTDQPSEISILAGVSLTLGERETLGIIGESGSGKTTLGRAIVGLIRISGGAVWVGGETVRGTSDRAWKAIRRNVGLMFQDPMAALDPRMTLGASITEQLAIYGETAQSLPERAEDLLRQVGLAPSFAQRYPHQISGGQARRVMVARALALGPRLVIADEPTAGLDLSVQGELLNLLGDVQERLGLSYLFITHNLAVARHVTDRLAIMYLGRIVETGTTSRIFSAPRHPYTRSLLDARKHHKDGRQVIEGEVPSLRHRPSGCEFHTRCPFARELCRTVPPTPEAIDIDHLVACHYPLGDGNPRLPGTQPLPRPVHLVSAPPGE